MKIHPIISFVFIVASSLANAAERVALVIGNGAYQHASKLPNATNDSKAIAKLLKDAGYEVVSSDSGEIGISDVGTEGFYSALERFKKASVGAKIGLVYYAGHGMEVDGRNFLLPVDASLESAAQLRTQAIPLDSILSDMNEIRIPAKIIILDCCRDNPLTRSWLNTRSTKKGMAVLKEDAIPEATMIMYSTAPGKVALDGDGNNSPFTKALLTNLSVRGTNSFEAFLKISDAVAAETNDRQVPWIKFDGAGRVFRTLSLLPGYTQSVELSQLATQSSLPDSRFRTLSAAEKMKFESLSPGANNYYKTTVRVGQNITGIFADLRSQASYSVVWADECKFDWKALQPDLVGIGSSLKPGDNQGIVFDYDQKSSDPEKWGGWYTAQKAKDAGRIFTVLRKDVAMPFFTTQTKGVSVEWIKPGADLQSPCWMFTYSGTFHDYESMDALQNRHNEEKVRKFSFVLLVFAEN